MRNLNETEAKTSINELAQAGEPFLCIISFDRSQSIIQKISELNSEEIKFDMEGVSNSSKEELGMVPYEYFERDIISYEEFMSSFDIVSENIHYGNSFLTNLTFKTHIDTNLTLDEIYQFSKAKYKLYVKDRFVLFSPESFVKIANGQISSFPMKGTIDAGIEGAEQIILNDPKEMAEHVTIVDLIRNDLSIVADEVKVSRFRYIDHLTTHRKNLLQVSSEINGAIKPEFQDKLGDLLFALLPAGSITGAPKPQTIKIIEEAESFDRGFYTGVFGYFDGRSFNSAVMIRFIETDELGTKYFKSGGGITHFSDPEKEYQEYLDKIYLPIPVKQMMKLPG